MAIDQQWAAQRAVELDYQATMTKQTNERKAAAVAEYAAFLARVEAYYETHTEVHIDHATQPRLDDIFAALDAQHAEAQRQQRVAQARIHAQDVEYYLGGMGLPPGSPFLAAATERTVNADFYDEQGRLRA